MSKQELMDKVINEAKGVWGSWFSFLYVSGELNVMHPKHTKFTYGTSESQNTGYWDLVCNVNQFRQRAKELGWVNGYKWSVEYPTNGKKPDLQDDVLVEVKVVRNEWGSAIPAGLIEFDETDLSAAAFRIVDNRYKPVSESQEKQQSVSDLPENNQKADSVSYNSWYERGELPPVGEWVEFDEYKNNNWRKVQIRGYWTENGNTSVWIQSVGKPNITKDKFRPIKTERELFQEAVLKSINGTAADCDIVLINTLYDAGFRAPE